MPGYISQIANLLTEDPDIPAEPVSRNRKQKKPKTAPNAIAATEEYWEKHTTIPYSEYLDTLNIIKDVARKNGLTFLSGKVKPKLNNSGIEIHNIQFEEPDQETREKLAEFLAQQFNDSEIRHKFGENLQANLLTAISGQLDERLKDSKSFEIDISAFRPEPGEAKGGERSEIPPVITVRKTQVEVEPPEEEMEPEAPMPGEEDPGMPPMEEPGMGGAMPMGGMGGDMGMPPMDEMPPLEGEGGMPDQGEMPEVEGGEEGEEFPEDEELPDEAYLDLGENINRIANMITEDPDILNELR